MWTNNLSHAYSKQVSYNTSTTNLPSYTGMMKPVAPPRSSAMRIRDLVAGAQVPKLIGVVIAKEDARNFPNKKDPSTERCLMNFTIRDSIVDFINVTCWGQREFISQISSSFHIGDVVEVGGALCQSKPVDGSDEKFRPATTSPYQLSVNENRSTIQPCQTWEATDMYNLACVPVKASNDFYTINDINLNGENINGELISLLVAVKKAGQIRDIVTKMGKQMKRCELVVFDNTWPSFTIVFWDSEQINLVQALTPREFVLFIADVRVKYDDYRKCMMATATSKTIITVNPDTREAQSILQYAQTAVLGDDDQVGGGGSGLAAALAVPMDLSSIKNVCKICDIQTMKTSVGGTLEGVLTYAFITDFDVDGSLGVVSERCAVCHQRLDASSGICVNHNCQQGSRFDLSAAQTSKDVQYDMRVKLSDHTGTIECILAGEVAASLFGVTASEFQSLTPEQILTIKWSFLLERCKVYLKVLPKQAGRFKSLYQILHCERANPREAIRHLI